MDTVNAWIGLALGVIGVLAGVGAMLRWAAGWLLRGLDIRIDTKLATFETKLDATLDAAFDIKLSPIHRRLDGIDTRLDGIDTRLDGIDTRLDGIDGRIDRLDAKVDHIAEVVDLRLRPLEADMALVKQHLLGTPAA